MNKLSVLQNVIIRIFRSCGKTSIIVPLHIRWKKLKIIYYKKILELPGIVAAEYDIILKYLSPHWEAWHRNIENAPLTVSAANVIEEINAPPSKINQQP